MNEVTKERVDLARRAYHQLVVAVTFAERELRGLGHTGEAASIGKFVDVFSRLGADHCDRIAMANGHHKDSQPEADTHLQPVENSQATADEEVASAGGGHVHGNSGPPTESADVTAAPSSEVVPIPLETVVQRRIDDLSPLEREEQRYEVALKFLHRARSILESGTDDRGRPTKREDKQQLAWKLIRSAENVVAGQKDEVAHG